MKLTEAIEFHKKNREYHKQEKFDYSKKAEIYKAAGEKEESKKFRQWALEEEVKEKYYEQAIISLKFFEKQSK